ncbi:hypothetical protein SK128_000796 [Halocaridina rubra]|uniref:Uncharacterized protein n=1 Tax=Halocaridina rubra TaxID=373956 RepID=A0AAN8XI34_HALRR
MLIHEYILVEKSGHLLKYCSSPFFEDRLRRRSVAQFLLVRHTFFVLIRSLVRFTHICSLLTCTMPPKHTGDSSDGNALKKKRAITMAVKEEIAKHSEKGETATNIARSLGLNRLIIQ